MAPPANPSRQRRRLRVQLRQARDTASLTQRQAAERLEWSLSKLIRIEAGTVGVSVTDLRAMLQLYDVTDETLMKNLTEAARGSKGQSWWSRYRDIVTPQFAQYLGHEGSASSIRVFHPFLIPGLLHTKEYASELLRVHSGTEKAHRLADLRMERQRKLFEQAEPPDVEFVLDEEALYRQIGGPAVMGSQLRRLLDASTRPGFSVQVVPYSAGAHPGLLGPFVLLSLADSDEDLLFAEGPGGDLVSRDDQDKIAEFIDYFETIRELALPDDRAKALIQELIGQLDQKASESPGKPSRPEPSRSAAELDPPQLLSGFADLRDDRWRSSRAGTVSPPARLRIARKPSLACFTSFPATAPEPAGLSRSSAYPSSPAASASRLSSACSCSQRKESSSPLPTSRQLRSSPAHHCSPASLPGSGRC
jgi:transcriptional regulator with XRE-family HTH domain